jgi:hypothetical protein
MNATGYRPLRETVFLMFLAGPVAAQDPAGRPGKVFEARRLGAEAPRIDGVLDDPAWKPASAVTDFTQKISIEGAQPSEKSEVWIAYDENALYIAARMHRGNPAQIRSTEHSSRHCR